MRSLDVIAAVVGIGPQLAHNEVDDDGQKEHDDNIHDAVGLGCLRGRLLQQVLCVLQLL